MKTETRKCWAQRAIAAICTSFPEADIGSWEACDRLAQQALTVSRLAKHSEFVSEQAANLLNEAAYYFEDRGEFQQSLLLFSQALSIRKALLRDDDPSIAVSLNNLGGILYVVHLTVISVLR